MYFFYALASWLDIAEFPINNSILSNTDNLGKLFDKQPPVHSCFSNLLAESLWLFLVISIEFVKIKAYLKRVNEGANVANVFIRDAPAGILLTRRENATARLFRYRGTSQRSQALS
jgi:hypothetical protein